MPGWVLKGGEQYLRHFDYVRSVKHPQWWSEPGGKTMQIGDPVFLKTFQEESLFGDGGIWALGHITRLLRDGRDNNDDLRFWKQPYIDEMRKPEKSHVEFEISEWFDDPDRFLQDSVLFEHRLFKEHRLRKYRPVTVQKLSDDEVADLISLLQSQAVQREQVCLAHLNQDELLQRHRAFVKVAKPSKSGPKNSPPRSPHLVLYIKRKAKHCCEYPDCNTLLFKAEDGQSFVEVHHVTPLALGGEDEPWNTVSLCPNCHRAMHHAADSKERKTRLCESVPRLGSRR